MVISLVHTCNYRMDVDRILFCELVVVWQPGHFFVIKCEWTLGLELDQDDTCMLSVLQVLLHIDSYMYPVLSTRLISKYCSALTVICQVVFYVHQLQKGVVCNI